MSAGRGRPRPPARATPATVWPPPRVPRVRSVAEPAARPCRPPRPPIATAASPPSSAPPRRPPLPGPPMTATPRRWPTAAHRAWAGRRIPTAPTAADRRSAPLKRVGRASSAARSTARGPCRDGRSEPLRQHLAERPMPGRRNVPRVYPPADWPANREPRPDPRFRQAAGPGVDRPTIGKEMPYQQARPRRLFVKYALGIFLGRTLLAARDAPRRADA